MSSEGLNPPEQARMSSEGLNPPERTRMSSEGLNPLERTRMDLSWKVPGFVELTELGAGGQGRAVLVQEEETGRVAVLKYSGTAGPGAIAAFRAESTLLKEVRSAHIAQWYGHYESPDGHHAAILMEAVDGASLRECLASYGPLPAEAALLVLKGSLLGLAAAHDRNVVHRDFKPGNIIVRSDGGSKLIDFGIATLAGKNAAVTGTPAYMAPEQWRREPPTPAMDVYGATCVFYECLTGRGPHPDGDPDGTSQVSTQQVAEPLRPLIRTGLAKDPAHRPASATEFVELLEEAATTAYGPDWELHGITGLSAAAATLAVLFPLTSVGLSSGTSATVGASSSGTTALGHTTARTTAHATARATAKASRRAASVTAKAGTVKTAIAVTVTVGLTAGAAGTVAYVRHKAAKGPAAVASPLADPSARNITVTTSYIGDPLSSTVGGLHVDQVHISGSPHDTQINAEIAAFANKLADAAGTGGQITALPAGFMNDVVTAKVRRAGPKLISIAYQIAQTGNGSADGGGVGCAAENINVATGAELGLPDLFTIAGQASGTDRLTEVIGRAGSATDASGGRVALTSDQVARTTGFLLPQGGQVIADGCPAFTGDSLEITYGSGFLDAMYVGPVTVAVPLADAKEFLQPITQ